MPRHLGNFPDTQAFGKFPRYPGIWENSQIPLKYLGIWEIPQMPGYLGNFQNLKKIQPSNTCRYLGNFPDTQAFGKLHRYPSNAWVFGKFPKCLGIWEIPQMPGYLGNFQNLKNIQPSNTCRHLRVVYF